MEVLDAGGELRWVSALAEQRGGDELVDPDRGRDVG